MLYVPPIRDYKPFYIQFGDGDAIDIKSAYSVIVKTHDYPAVRKPKDPYKNDWKDEHGDDEYLGQVFMEAFTFNAECAMFAEDSTGGTAIDDLNDGIQTFMSALSSGEFSTYDAWTGFGFQHVRLSEFKMPSSGDYKAWNGKSRVIFNVEFKVNDPITRMVLSNGSIVSR